MSIAVLPETECAAGRRPRRSWAIAVFAHNEARNISTALDSILANCKGASATVTVLANGCRDATEARVREYAESCEFVHLESISLGDKANAWNTFVHGVAPRVDTYFFLDGDCVSKPGALTALSDALNEDGLANAAAAVPATGRSRIRAREHMVSGHELAGNLYALPHRFVDAIRRQHVRLPIGFIGDDSLVGALAKWDLDPRGTWLDTRVVVVPEASFTFRSLSTLTVRDMRVYMKRRIRYRIRSYQIALLRSELKARGLAGMPGNIRDLYRGDLAALPSSGQGFDMVFDRLAIRRMRNDLRASERRQ